MIRIFLPFTLIFTFVAACSDDELDRKTVEYFEQNLRRDMSQKKLLMVFGKPVEDIGSGIHIYVYHLDDSTEVWIGFTDMVIYANLVDKDQNLLKILM